MKKDSAFKLKSGNRPSIAKLMGGSVVGGVKKRVSDIKEKKAAEKDKLFRQYVRLSNKDPKKYPPIDSDKFRPSMLKKKIDIKIDKKGIKTKVSRTVTYKDAYNRMSQKQRSKFKDFADFESQAKAYNRKKYGTINPTAKAKKVFGPDKSPMKPGKQKLAEANKLKKVSRGDLTLKPISIKKQEPRLAKAFDINTANRVASKRKSTTKPKRKVFAKIKNFFRGSRSA